MEERNLELTPRKEEITDCSNVVVKFEIDEIKQHYQERVDEIEKQCSIALELINCGKQEQAENIWRAQVVFLESAFDFYLHEVTKYGLSKIFDGYWKATKKYNNMDIKMELVHKVIKSAQDSAWFLKYINDYYKEVTMVSFSSFKEQMNLLGLEVKAIADKAFYEIGETEKTISKLKRRLNELYDRRNIIAHQFDRKHSNAVKKEISECVVKDFIKDMTKIVDAINYAVIKHPCNIA